MQEDENSSFLNNSHSTEWGISRLTSLWGISRLTPLYPTNTPGSQYIVVGGKAVRNAWHGCQVHTTSRSWDKGVLTDLCLKGVLTDLCLKGVLTDLCLKVVLTDLCLKGVLTDLCLTLYITVLWPAMICYIFFFLFAAWIWKQKVSSKLLYLCMQITSSNISRPWISFSWIKEPQKKSKGI